MYDPKVARFLQEDTYTGTADDPLSLNLYTYVKNNPLIYYDPTGHAEMRLSFHFYNTNQYTIVINGVAITYDPTFQYENEEGNSFGTKFVEFVYKESREVKIKDPTYYYDRWDSGPLEIPSVWDNLTNAEIWKRTFAATGDFVWNGTKNLFGDIFSDEDTTGMSITSYTPEQKQELIL